MYSFEDGCNYFLLRPKVTEFGHPVLSGRLFWVVSVSIAVMTPHGVILAAKLNILVEAFTAKWL